MPVALAVTVTVCAVAKLAGVKVRLAGEAVRPALPLPETVTVTFEAGAWDRARVNVPVLPWVTFRLAGVAVMEPAGGGVVDPVGVQVTEVGAALVPE